MVIGNLSAGQSNRKFLPHRFDVLVILLKNYPQRSAVILGAMFVAGMAESIGIMSLLPFLELTVGDKGQNVSRLSAIYHMVLSGLGLTATVPVVLAAIVILISIKAGLTFYAMNHIGAVLAQMAAELRKNLMRATLAARWLFFVKYPIGRFVNAVAVEAGEATSTYRAVCQFLAAIMQVTMLLFAAFLVSPELTAVAFVAGLLMMSLLGYFVTLARRAGQALVGILQSLTGKLADGLQGIKPLKAMNCERWLIPLLESETTDFYRTVRLQVLAKYGLSVLREPIIVLALVIGIYAALEFGQVPMAALLTMAVLFHRTAANFGQVQQAYQQIGTSEYFYWSIRNLIEEAHGEREAIGGEIPPKFNRSIMIRKVVFSYGETEVLREVSLDILPQTFTAIIGPSGAGKTTLVDLICGLYMPNHGEVLIDGVPLSRIDIALWRQQIGYVPQELFLFHDTVLKNVTLGDPGIDKLVVEKSLCRAGAWEFVTSLPQGIDTLIGERGLTLSGGQRQRLAIARALARDPQLLILDEATTALDPALELEICRTLQQLSSKVTIVAISHQTTMIEMANFVYRIENGEVSQIK